MNIQQNFTRKWRSKTFEEIVGQELSVRLLKNSLEKNRLFPVYLFSGLRGSGKTSIGRIFAAAVNCERRQAEKSNTTTTVPCLTCASCIHVRAGSHPDFIEIDAASNTGVDNIRQIIESAAFLPSMSAKKVYLIDEAHMLSKAAFNAFLKILEEPPATVIFLLATTEVHKIPDTVRSRSFHLVFYPIQQDDLTAHLKHVCMAESIDYEEAALPVIAAHSEGSARDALNTMERIVLADTCITTNNVYQTLGLIHDALVIQLFEIIARGSVTEVLEYCNQQRFNRLNPFHIWEKMIMILRVLLHAGDGAYHHDVKHLRSLYTRTLVLDFFDLLYRSEAHMVKTTAQYIFLESILCKMTQRFDTSSVTQSMGSQSIERTQKPTREVPIQHDRTHEEKRYDQELSKKPESTVARDSVSGTNGNALLHSDQRWHTFLNQLEQVDHPMAVSIFKQGNCTRVDNEQVHVDFAKRFEFYHEWMKTNERLWKPALETIYGSRALLVPHFVTHESVNQKPSAPRSTLPPASPTGNQARGLTEGNAALHSQPEEHKAVHNQLRQSKSAESVLDVHDSQKWPLAHKMMQMFPGTITEYKE